MKYYFNQVVIQVHAHQKFMCSDHYLPPLLSCSLALQQVHAYFPS